MHYTLAVVAFLTVKAPAIEETLINETTGYDLRPKTMRGRSRILTFCGRYQLAICFPHRLVISNSYLDDNGN